MEDKLEISNLKDLIRYLFDVLTTSSNSYSFLFSCTSYLILITTHSDFSYVIEKQDKHVEVDPSFHEWKIFLEMDSLISPSLSCTLCKMVLQEER